MQANLDLRMAVDDFNDRRWIAQKRLSLQNIKDIVPNKDLTSNSNEMLVTIDALIGNKRRAWTAFRLKVS